MIQVKIIMQQDYNAIVKLCKEFLDSCIVDASKKSSYKIDVWKNISSLWCVYINLFYHVENKQATQTHRKSKKMHHSPKKNGMANEVAKIFQLFPSKSNNEDMYIIPIEKSIALADQAIEKCPYLQYTCYIWILKSRYTIRKAMYQLLHIKEDQDSVIFLSKVLHECKQICYNGIISIDENNECRYQKNLFIQQKQLLIDEINKLTYSWENECKTLIHNNAFINGNKVVINGMNSLYNKAHICNGSANHVQNINQDHKCDQSNHNAQDVQNQTYKALHFDKEDIINVLDYIFEIHIADQHDIMKEQLLKHSNVSYIPYFVGQVGIRCIFCSHCEVDCSTIYPKSIESLNIAQSTLFCNHLKVCTYIPDNVRQRCNSLWSDDTYDMDLYQYWTNIANEMNIVNHPNFGLRFKNSTRKELYFKYTTSDGTVTGDVQDSSLLRPICQVNNNDALTLLLNQFSVCGNHVKYHSMDCDYSWSSDEICTSTEQCSKYITPNFCPVGCTTHGLICRYCYDKGETKVGHINVRSITANSYGNSKRSERLKNHVLDCPHVPESVRKRIRSSTIDSDEVLAFLKAFLRRNPTQKGKR